MNVTLNLLNIIEWLGTVAFAISGAATAIERRLDLFGVLFMGLTTAMGGGLMRDIIIGSTPPALFRSTGSVILALVTALIVFVWAYKVRNSFASDEGPLALTVESADALGLGIFSAIGTRVAMYAGYVSNPFLCVCMGMMTACGGGALRDVLSREIPFVFTKQIYAVASMAGSIVYYLLSHCLHFHAANASLMTVAVTTALRLIAIRRHWNLPKVPEDKHTVS